MARSVLSAHNLRWQSGNREIIKDIAIEIHEGEFFGIIGPNGSGKSSLISILAGLQKASAGNVTLFDRSIQQLNRREIAQQIALVKQSISTIDRITARQAVELGRTPYLSFLAPWSAKDDAIVDEALEIVGMTALQSQLWNTLSGGEQQRLHIARALAQKAKILILDEPTNNLDIHHQLNLLALVKKQQITTVAVLHDLNHAAIYCDRIAVLEEGRIKMLGSPISVLTQTMIQSVFKVNAECTTDDGGKPFIRFLQPLL